MTQYLVTPSKLRGALILPSSKSQTLRALLFGALGSGTTIVHNPLYSTDTQAMMQACRLFGARLTPSAHHISIEGISGTIPYTEDVINAGNSGIVLRFCTAVGALSQRPVVITGDDSIRHQRPMQPLIGALSQLGVTISSMRGDGFAPLIVQGPLLPGKAQLCGHDSQPVSALLIASAFAPGPIHIEVTEPGEIPWVQLTLNWLSRLGVPYEAQGFTRYQLFGNARYAGFEYRVPGDLSSLAFPVGAALVTDSELVIHNVNLEEDQGDKALIEILLQMGASIDIDAQTLIVKRGGALRGISVDMNPLIDALPALAIIACFASGTTTLYNASIARTKECNRLSCLVSELRKMGALIEETATGLEIQGKPLQGASLFSHHDHRMAMALTVAALGAQGESRIEGCECIGKTYPTFQQDFNALGAKII